MKLPSIQNLMRKLSIIPGLTFLERWVTEMNTLQTQTMQRVDDLQGYVNVAREGAGEVSGAVRGDAYGDDSDDSEDYLPRSEAGGEYGYGSSGGYGPDASDADGYDSDSYGQDGQQSPGGVSRNRGDGYDENYEDVFYDRED